MTKKMTREEAKKKIEEIEASVEKFREDAMKEMSKLADEHDLSFYYQGRGRYYGGPKSMEDDGMEADYLYDGWHDSACS